MHRVHSRFSSSLFSALSLSALAALASTVTGCSSSSSASSPVDGGSHDAVTKDGPSTSDAKATDGASADAADAGSGDGGPVSSIPITQTLTASVLTAPVDVVRDEYGIPHIYGQDFTDVAYAEGYVMASDRLVEMDLGRRQAAGTLTELVGPLQPSIIAADIAMRMHHLTSTAQATWTQLKASTAPNDVALASAITKYAAGINAFVTDVNAGNAALPPAVLGLYSTKNFAPWTEIDSIVLSYFQAFELVYDSDTELTYTHILAAGAQVFDQATDPNLAARKGIGKDFELLAPQDPTFTLPSGWTGMNGDTSQAKAGPARRASKPGATSAPRHAEPGVLARVAPKATDKKNLLALLTADEKTMHGVGNDRTVYQLRGSNNFILGPGLTADGNVLIGNDTHLSLSNPPIFYLVQLVASGGQVPVNAMGVNFPGIPGIVLGNNEHVAWAATDNYIDVTDVYQESVVNCADSTPFAGTASR